MVKTLCARCGRELMDITGLQADRLYVPSGDLIYIRDLPFGYLKVKPGQIRREPHPSRAREQGGPILTFHRGFVRHSKQIISLAWASGKLAKPLTNPGSSLLRLSWSRA